LPQIFYKTKKQPTHLQKKKYIYGYRRFTVSFMNEKKKKKQILIILSQTLTKQTNKQIISKKKTEY
jgi:hypothetical protein